MKKWLLDPIPMNRAYFFGYSLVVLMMPVLLHYIFTGLYPGLTRLFQLVGFFSAVLCLFGMKTALKIQSKR